LDLLGHARCLHFLAIMRRPPPISTLFPYTTLFRSSPPSCRTPPPPHRCCLYGACCLYRARTKKHLLSLMAEQVFFCPGTVRTSSDRKSTRLNSSHVKTSYAVFCLKNKNRRYKDNTT